MSFKPKFNISNKYIKIDKANQMVVIAVSVTVAVVIFCAVASQSLIKQIKYQGGVISKREAANKVLEKNLKSIDTLVASYAAFDSTPESVIGTADKNSKVILNALPSKYDFPALATTMDNFYKSTGVSNDGFNGTDEEATAVQSSDSPTPIEIIMPISAKGDITSVQKLFDYINRSIKPIKISTVSISGTDKNLSVSLDGVTYYQPEKVYKVNYEVAKPAGQKTTKKTTTTSTASDAKKSATEVTK